MVRLNQRSGLLYICPNIGQRTPVDSTNIGRFFWLPYSGAAGDSFSWQVFIENTGKRQAGNLLIPASRYPRPGHRLVPIYLLARPARFAVALAAVPFVQHDHRRRAS